MNRALIVGDDGLPSGVLDLSRFEGDATLLAFRLAVASDDASAVSDVLSDALESQGVETFGHLAAAALRVLTENVVAPLLEVTDALGDAGYLKADVRAGLEDALANAEAALGGGA